MAQLSGITAAVKNKNRVLILGQVVFEPFKLAVRNADGSRDVAFVIFGAFGS